MEKQWYIESSNFLDSLTVFIVNNIMNLTFLNFTLVSWCIARASVSPCVGTNLSARWFKCSSCPFFSSRPNSGNELYILFEIGRTYVGMVNTTVGPSLLLTYAISLQVLSIHTPYTNFAVIWNTFILDPLRYKRKINLNYDSSNWK